MPSKIDHFSFNLCTPAQIAAAPSASCLSGIGPSEPELGGPQTKGNTFRAANRDALQQLGLVLGGRWPTGIEREAELEAEDPSATKWKSAFGQLPKE